MLQSLEVLQTVVLASGFWGVGVQAWFEAFGFRA